MGITLNAKKNHSKFEQFSKWENFGYLKMYFSPKGTFASYFVPVF